MKKLLVMLFVLALAGLVSCGQPTEEVTVEETPVVVEETPVVVEETPMMEEEVMVEETPMMEEEMVAPLPTEEAAQ